MNDNTTPLPCPFCDSDQLLEYHDPRTTLHPWYRIECDHCGCNGPGSDRGDHIELWNTRATQAAPAVPSHTGSMVNQQFEELAMMIRMLVSALRKARPCAPGDLDYRAIDLLRRYDLLGSPLRDSATHPAMPEDVRDAARYRFLRDTAWPPVLHDVIAMHRNKRWDIEIDAAMAAAAGDAK